MTQGANEADRQGAVETRRQPKTDARTKMFVWGALGLASLAGLAFWGQHLFVREPTSANSTPDELASDWPVGQQATYRVHWKSDATAVGVNAETGGEERERLSHIDVHGQLALTRLEGAAGELTFSARLLEPVSESELPGQASVRSQELTTELSQAFLIHFTRAGQVDRVQMPKALGTTGFAVFKSIASFLQKVGPPAATGAPKAPFPVAGPKQEWRAIEPDLSGRAEFVYALNDAELRKTKLAYVSLVEAKVDQAQALGEAKVEVLESSHVHRLGRHGSSFSWTAPVESVQVRETTRVTLGDAMAPMESETEFSMERGGAMSRLNTDEVKMLSTGDWVSAAVDQLPLEEARHRDRDTASVAGRSLQQLTQAITNLEQAVPRNRRGEARVFSALVSKLRVDAQALKEAGQKIRSGIDQKLLLDALGNTGTPESQALLAELLKERRFDHEQTRSSLINLGMSKAPTPATVEYLKEARADPQHGNQARLGLGSAAHSLNDTDPGAAIAIVEELEKDLKSTKTPNQTEVGLRALGNSGNALVLDTCESYLKGTHPSAKIGAIACARLVPGPRADSIIAQGLSDSYEGVVREAISAASQRPYGPAMAPPLIALAKTGANRTVRILATQVLGRYAPAAPELIAVIADIAASDPDVELKSYAERLMAKLVQH